MFQYDYLIFLWANVKCRTPQKDRDESPRQILKNLSDSHFPNLTCLMDTFLYF